MFVGGLTHPCSHGLWSAQGPPLGLDASRLYGLDASRLYGLDASRLYGLDASRLYGLDASRLYGHDAGRLMECLLNGPTATDAWLLCAVAQEAWLAGSAS